MTLSKLRELVRLRIRDTKKPYFFSDQEIDANINEAQREACTRAFLIEDDEVTTVDIVTGECRYDLDPRVIDVLDISIGTTNPQSFTDGWTLTEGKLLLEREPVADDVLTLRAYLLPSAEMVDDDDEPEIREVHQTRMLDWAISLCFQVQDADAFDQNAADRYAAKFSESFGDRPNALTMRNWRDKSIHVVNGNGYI